MLIDLLKSSYFSLFLIVALGFMLGRIKIKGLSLDVSAVIFIALLFGHFGVIIPKELGNFGLVLFIFTIGIHAIYSVSEELILWATEFARRHNLKIHIHVAESEREDLECKAAHGGLSPVEYLDALGVLGPDVIAAHTLWLSEHDIELLGRHHVNCVHNINSNTKLSSGYKFKWKELTEAGANVCLGTDGCASSNNLDMLEAMKTTALFQKAWRKDPSALPLKTLMEMATVNGAKALGLKTGTIKEGYEADIQIVDTDNTFFLSPGPFLANFIYSAHSDCVSSLIAGGKFLMRDRMVPDEKAILKGARGVLDEIDYKQ